MSSQKNCCQPRHFRYTGIAIALSALALGLSVIKVTSSLMPAAHAQAILDDEVTNYARAVLDIETLRVAAYASASDLLAAAGSEEDILDIRLSCTANRLSDMPDISRADRVDLRTILVDFCNEASLIADANDLTPKRFNSITAAHREDADLAARIQAIIAEL